MLTLNLANRFIKAAVLAALLLAAAPPAQAQDKPAAKAGAEAERGFELLQQGNHAAAVELLRKAVKENKQDAVAWRYLGLAYAAIDELKEARKALEQAVTLAPDSAPAHAASAYVLVRSNRLRDAERAARQAVALDPRHKESRYALGLVSLRTQDFDAALAEAEAALAIDAEYASALLLKTQALIGKSLDLSRQQVRDEPRVVRARLDEAQQAFGKYIRLIPQAQDSETLLEQLEAVRVYANAHDGDDPARTVFKSSEVTKRAEILAKPEPNYTERARRNGTHGIVRLRLTLAADGRVKYILPVRTLPDGLTENAVAAARRIRFVPAEKDGRPVSTVVTVEYGFAIH